MFDYHDEAEQRKKGFTEVAFAYLASEGATIKPLGAYDNHYILTSSPAEKPVVVIIAYSSALESGPLSLRQIAKDFDAIRGAVSAAPITIYFTNRRITPLAHQAYRASQVRFIDAKELTESAAIHLKHDLNLLIKLDDVLQQLD